MIAQVGLNSIVVEKETEGGDSRLTRCLGFPPIKFINPRALRGCCQIYVSNYGGGLVDGDTVRMRVDCLPGSRMYLGTQSSTKVYRSEGRGGCAQETFGMLHANALAVVCPDPVVPFKGSRYRQTQTWEVHPEADLILFDWLQPGRAARGEVFAYTRVRSELRVTRPDGTPLLTERFALEPDAQDPYRCGRFGAFQSLLCVYLIGPRALSLGEALEPAVLALNKPINGSGRDASAADSPASWVGMGRREGVGCMIRALGADRRDLQPLHDLIFKALSDAAWLGFNPWHRRW